MTPETTTIVVGGLTAAVSAFSALTAVVITSIYFRRREHEADWRKMKANQYQGFIIALSGVVRGRESLEAHLRYADAVNSINIVASAQVLKALTAFQKEVSYINSNRSDERHDKLLEIVIQAMRNDIRPEWLSKDQALSFRLLGLPPTAHEGGRER